MSQMAFALDGFDCGPLFEHGRVRRPSMRALRRESGGKEVWRKWKRAMPVWADKRAVRAFWKASAAMTAETGIQHSVDHIVPLLHPLVCGLHVEHNLEVTTLAANLQKSNNHWPDMWGQQPELFE